MKEKERALIDFLRELDIFHRLSDAIIAEIIKNSKKLSKEPGQPILRQGERAEAFYIIISGAAEGVYEDKNCIKSYIFYFSGGDYFPFKSLFTNKPSRIGFYAIQRTLLLALPKRYFLDFLSVNPPVKEMLFERMVDRSEVFAIRLIETRRWHRSFSSLTKKVEAEAPFLVGKTEVMKALWDRLPGLASNMNPILIKGEFGVGKELIAEIIHSKGPLRERPFIIIDAFDISGSDWMEDFQEDYGQGEKRRFRLFPNIGSGTILLKNIEAVSLPLQKRLKRYFVKDLKRGREERGGSPDMKDVSEGWIERYTEEASYQRESDMTMSDVILQGPESAGTDKQAKNRYSHQIKLIFTTRKNLEEIVAEGGFDPELYSIIGKEVISIPPLRERKLDILELAQYFITYYSDAYKKGVKRLSRRAREQLLAYDFQRGNIQELEEIIKRGVALTDTDSVRSEHLFLGHPAADAKVLYNPLKIKILNRMVREGLYPGIFKYTVVAFFFIIMLFCFLGPQDDPARNFGTFIVWWMWWPFLCLFAFWIGRTWCSVCAYASIGHAVQKRINLKLKFPRILKDYDYLVAIFIFLFVVWVEEASKMRTRPVYTGLLLVSILCIEVLFSILFQRDIWCRHVCPMGNMIGVFAMTSVLEVRGNQNICTNQCMTNECYNGSGDLLGCPMFQHLEFVDNNQTCKLCLNCIRVCPHKAVSLNIRYPFCEIWESNQVRPGMAFFVLTLMAVLFPVLKPLNLYFMSIVFYLLSPALVIALVWFVSWLGFYNVKGRVYEGFWRTAYAYVPLTLAAHIAYQIQYLPWLRDMKYEVFLKGSSIINLSSLPHLLQAFFLFLGFIFSLYSIIRIYKKSLSKLGSPNWIYWFGHIAIMLFYPVIILYMLG